MSKETTLYTIRKLARIIVEAKTPLAVGSGEKDVLTDSMVATDVNGVPYIPGTAIAGVLRHAMDAQSVTEDSFWGFQQKKIGKGSRLIISDARILDSKGDVCDGMHSDIDKDDLLKEYKELPIRQHVRIGHRGVTENAGKFDQQVVYAGTRFCFEMELMPTKDDSSDDLKNILNKVKSGEFRLGGGTRNGFGELEVKEIREATIDLSNPEDLVLYAEKSSNLSESAQWKGWKAETVEIQDADPENWNKYELTLHPQDFFMFGSGMGDEDGDADMTAVSEQIVEWTNGKGKLSEKKKILIPATSVKGALSHRTAFHYNKTKGYTVGMAEAKAGDKNPAVAALFGTGTESEKGISRGNVIFSDVIEHEVYGREKIMNHVSIDRFTGGAIDGALFAEKPIFGKGLTFEMTILVKKSVISEAVKAFEAAMQDVCKGLLPLGGGVNRGHGMFTGELKQDGKVIYPEKK